MFSKVIYINLDRRMDRKNNLINELDRINYNGRIERLSAIDAKKLNFDLMPTNLFTKESIKMATDKTEGLYSYMTKGGIGCALSHKMVYEKILAGDDEYVLILEDDIWFDDNFNIKLEQTLKKIGNNYDILWLGYHSKSTKTEYVELDVPETLYGLFGYIINKKAAKKLIEIFPITMQIDTEIPKIFMDLRVYALKENDRIIFSEPSQIATTFGTDIQVREDFKSISECKNGDNVCFVIFCMILLMLLYLLFNAYKNKMSERFVTTSI